ncbi:MFS transporter [Patescibacteria group bacterium]|uniref:MFS transporter n=1 Tax=candidate division WWE3 bacterium TaxID=2053526 RepID=A0A928TS69_UNCKA|nr:MFS transporter [candidate division WWE3 bacterium]MCL4732237.1 MFS transporter [Patescibacteria group bacterium]MDL1953136.1 MFS transporter [Candidatus Uhrbacteria bacterium UHB]RIL00407.1 MAG: MFS transporter [Candidatus Uhrbacteria bacterium]
MLSRMAKRENPYISLIANIVLPTIVLTRLSVDGLLGPTYGLLAALSFPITYGALDFWRRKKVNFFSALGLASVLLTGGIGLLKLDPQYIALKEAGVPLLVSFAVFASMKTKFPIVKSFLQKLMDYDKVQTALEERKNTEAFDRHMTFANHLFAGSFLVSAALNFFLAKWIVVSAPGTEAFNAELGKMTALSFPVIALPITLMMAFVLYGIISKTEQLTDLNMEDFFFGAKGKEKEGSVS